MKFAEQQPIYMQIADIFCENILSGKWKPNDRIPSVRDIAMSMEVNPNTAMRSFEFLQNQEIIFNKRGIGYFVSEDGHHKALDYKREEFLSKTVPEFFRNMYLLGIKYEEMEEYYKKSVR
ncbi:MAG: GntR family transcriptional regulator [Bacteroidales bacterium]|jgi:DNA-binding transcriptional regulator YhcF (GntR family)|nr:GntR family transcriptional regulator [Bacteroidales bacterium]MDD4671875.1 GntR family transcriptional regulator [Bacteroidales bacterium]MDY0349159.1 GntR family transcriptional regulator [Tenuifilaceae bacterium]